MNVCMYVRMYIILCRPMYLYFQSLHLRVFLSLLAKLATVFHISFTFTFQEWDPAVIVIDGPSTLTSGTTGIWLVTVTLAEISNHVILDVLVPLDEEDVSNIVMSVDMISVEFLGQS